MGLFLRKKCEKIMKNLAVRKKKHYNVSVFPKNGIHLRRDFRKDAFDRLLEERYRMNNMKKRMMALLLSGVLAVSMFAGCGSKLDKTATVATLGETQVSLGVANFAARLQQAQYDDFYTMYFGQNAWKTDMYGTGTTLEDDLKSGVLQSLNAMYAMKANMADYGVEITAEDVTAISAAAESFISSNSAEAVEALGAEREYVEAYLELLTIQARMYDEIVKDANTNVTEAEANTSSYSYVRVSRTNYTDEEGKSTEHTEETLATLAAEMEAFMAAVKADGFDAAAKAKEYNVYEGTFNSKSTDIDEKVLTALADLEEGEVSELIETASQYYVVRLDAKTDRDATEANRQNIITERQNALYTEVVEEMMKELTWTVNEKVWEQVSFKNLFTIVEKTTELSTEE